MTLAKRTLGSLTYGGKGLVQQIVKPRALFDAAAVLDGFRAQVFVAQRFEVLFQGVDRLNVLAQLLQEPIVGGAKEALGNRLKHSNPRCNVMAAAVRLNWSRRC